jgi:PAS domain S-box-containing protein
VAKPLQESEISGKVSSDGSSGNESSISQLELLEAVIEGSPDPIFAKDAEGRFLLVNSACANAFGRPREEIYGRRVSELVDDKLATQIELAESCVIATGEPLVTEGGFAHPDRTRTYMVTKSALRNAAGKVIGIVGVARDITERKRMEEALGESEARYRMLTEAAPQLIWMADSAGTLQFSNRYFRDVTGLSLEEAIQYGQELIHPEDRPAVDAKWREAAEHGEGYEIEYRLKNALSGSYTWFCARIQPIRDKNGQIFRWIGSAYDTNERKQTALDIQRREEQLRLAQEAGQIGAWTLDLESGEVSYSAGFHDLLGVDPSVTITRDLLVSFVVAEDRARAEEMFRSAGSESVRVEFRIQRGRETRWLLSLGRRVREGAKLSTLFAGVTLDMTAQKQAEEELAKQAADLARSNTDLQQFSSIASHDLQEPLRNMAICSELLNRNYRHLLDDHGKQLVDLISSGAKSGQALTQALLSYARTVGPEVVPMLPVNTAEAFDQAMVNLKSTIQETKAIITRDKLPVVRGDYIQLTQLFQNLLENAIKYSGQVAPVVHVGCEKRGTEWRISVRDNGMGVPESYYEQIFQPFQRLKPANISGSGLGLATCKRIVERHGGSIWVESKEGQGSTFFFTIPVQTES